MELTPEQQTIRDLSDRMVAAQHPLRILDAIKWDTSIYQEFFKHQCKELPKVTADYYRTQPLPFDPRVMKEEFYAIERDIHHKLGQFGGVGSIMLRTCHEYQRAISMLEARGKPEFSRIAIELYGSAEDVFYVGAPALIDLSKSLADILTVLNAQLLSAADIKKYTSEEAVAILDNRFNDFFDPRPAKLAVMLSDDIIADAAAGAECIKLRRDAMFSDRDLRLLEVHEGWVHVGTTANGLRQPICTFLGKGTPSSAITQEGLAVVMEILTFSSYPSRVKRLCDRVTAINMAENGANFLEVFNYFLSQGSPKEQSYHNSVRVFRGSLPEAGPFTKDLSYTKGFILVYNYIRLAIQGGLLENIATLFVGKTRLEDLQVISDLIKEGLVTAPMYMPPQMRDLAALSSWMCFSLFMDKLDGDKFSANFKEILHS